MITGRDAETMTTVTPFQIVIATDLTDDARQILRLSDSIETHFVTPNIPTVREQLRTAHAIIARDDVPLDSSMLEAAPTLRVIGRVGASLSGIDIEYATQRGILVMHTPGANAVAAGEHTLALMLALSRRLVSAHNSLKEGFWLLDRKQHAGTQLRNKTLGLIGLGRVGQVVAQRCLAFGMNVLAYDPYVVDEHVSDPRVQMVSLKELLVRSDYVSLHVPATAETRNMVDGAFIRQMKPGARLINTAFGGLIDEMELAAALREGRLAGAAIDVYREEPPYNSPLIGLDNVIHTPHIGDNTVEAAQDLSIQIVHQVLDALRGSDYRNVVNLPFMPGVDFEKARPYMALAESMGAMLHTLARAPIRRVAVEYRGDELAALVKPITVGLLKGVLAPILSDYVNYINAPVIAADRGVQVTQAKGLKSTEYASIVLAQATLEDGEEITISGTLLDKREPLIVQINDYRVQFVPRGNLLIMGSYDQPGVIGRVGTMLANNGINIAIWQTGRATPGGHTLTILTLDEPLPDHILEELRAQDFIRHAHQVRV
jgi:D-3-phosphoglycerate dehydrogenase